MSPRSTARRRRCAAPDGSVVTATLAGAPPASSDEFVGAFVASSAMATLPLYPKFPLATTPPPVGTSGATAGCDLQRPADLWDRRERVRRRRPVWSRHCDRRERGCRETVRRIAAGRWRRFFGSFIGGATTLTVWSVPVFLPVTPAALITAGASSSTSGDISLSADVSGASSFQLAVADSSLFIFSNIDVDTRTAGSTSAANVFLAGATINSAPDNTTSVAFAPSAFLLGIVRPVQMGGGQQYAFIPEDDSVVIGGVRYLTGAIALETIAVDPMSLPVPPIICHRRATGNSPTATTRTSTCATRARRRLSGCPKHRATSRALAWHSMRPKNRCTCTSTPTARRWSSGRFSSSRSRSRPRPSIRAC